jgi:hypothetical protein
VREKAAVAQRQEGERTESTAEIIAATLAAGQNATAPGEEAAAEPPIAVFTSGRPPVGVLERYGLKADVPAG